MATMGCIARVRHTITIHVNAAALLQIGKERLFSSRGGRGDDDEQGGQEIGQRHHKRHQPHQLAAETQAGWPSLLHGRMTTGQSGATSNAKMKQRLPTLAFPAPIRHKPVSPKHRLVA